MYLNKGQQFVEFINSEELLCNMTEIEKLLKPPDWLCIYLLDRESKSDHLIKWDMFRLDQLLAYDLITNHLFCREVMEIKYKFLALKKKLYYLYTLRKSQFQTSCKGKYI